MITGFRRVVKAGFVGFWRNTDVSLTSVYVISIALFVVGCAMFMDQVLTKTLNNIAAQVDVNLYFVPEASQDGIDNVISAVESLPEVVSVNYTSREEALEDYRSRNQNDLISLQALEALDDNPLGANIAILAQEPSQYGQIAQFIEEIRAQESPSDPVIGSFNYDRAKVPIDNLTRIIQAIEGAGVVVVTILLSAATLITFNTIRLVIYTSRDEIAVMRLVGAGKMFIRGPFMLQGILYGFLSGLLTMALFYPTLLWFGPRTEEFFDINLFVYYTENFGMIFATLVGIGVILGLVSSTLAVTRYLRT